MTRDTDRPRRGTDRPAFAKTGAGRARPSRSTDKPVAMRGEGKPPREGTTFTKALGEKPKREERNAKPARSTGSASRATAVTGSEPIATIATPERQRIAKLMARVGLCSRRDAEAWIVDGRVTLNGEILTSPAMDVGPNDTILVDGIPLPAAEKTRLFLFHKPRGLVTSDHDPEGRETVADYLAEHWPDGPRVVTIGRLDINTEGLLLLTNDGGLARVLELPATGWVRRYRVRAKGETDQGVLDRLRDGIVVDGVDYAGIEAKLDRIQGANCWLTMGLREGKNREIKRVLEHLGLEVNRLIRLSFGPFQLLDLPEGKVEEVKTRILRDQLGETLSTEAGVDFADSDAPIVAAPVTPRDKSAKTSRRNESGKPERRIEPKRDASAPRGRPGFEDRGSRGSPSRDRDEDETKPIREKPVAGTRRHVSTLRAEVASDQRKGPRKRIERANTTDRKDRVVKVERLVSTRSPEAEAPRARRGAGRLAPREGQSEGRKLARGHTSPSALAKRERIAKSGGDRPQDRAAVDRPRQDRDDRRGPTGPKMRSVRPDLAPARVTRTGDEKPWRGERSAGDERSKSVRRGADERGENRSSAASFRSTKRPERPAGTRSASADRDERPARNVRPSRNDAGSTRPARTREDGDRNVSAKSTRDGASTRGGPSTRAGRPPARGGAPAGGKPSKPRAPKR